MNELEKQFFKQTKLEPCFHGHTSSNFYKYVMWLEKKLLNCRYPLLGEVRKMSIYVDGEKRKFAEALKIMTDEWIDDGECCDNTIKDICKILRKINRHFA